jgi:hypothetical protein
MAYGLILSLTRRNIDDELGELRGIAGAFALIRHLFEPPQSFWRLMPDLLCGLLRCLKQQLPQYSLEEHHASLSAKLVPLRVVQFKGGRQPQPNACHGNVEQWAKQNPQHRPVRGWLITSGFVFDRHSLLADERGELFDITPIQQPYRPPFLTHPGNEDEFMALPAQIILIEIPN